MKNPLAQVIDWCFSAEPAMPAMIELQKLRDWLHRARPAPLRKPGCLFDLIRSLRHYSLHRTIHEIVKTGFWYKFL